MSLSPDKLQAPRQRASPPPFHSHTTVSHPGPCPCPVPSLLSLQTLVCFFGCWWSFLLLSVWILLDFSKCFFIVVNYISHNMYHFNHLNSATKYIHSAVYPSHHASLELAHHPNINSVPIKHQLPLSLSPQPPVYSLLLPVSMNLPDPGNSCK